MDSDVAATVAESEEFIATGAHDVIYVLRDELAVTRAEQIAEALPVRRT